MLANPAIRPATPEAAMHTRALAPNSCHHQGLPSGGPEPSTKKLTTITRRIAPTDPAIAAHPSRVEGGRKNRGCGSGAVPVPVVS